jgi:hypothetical protein
MEPKEKSKPLDEKVDLLLEESKKAMIERKRERVLSKVDGLYNVLIALSTFLVGLVISQHDFFINASSFGLFLPITGIIVSMIISYVVGFMGMVKDSIENRILSWGLFLTSVTLLGVSSLPPSSFFVGYDIVSGLVRGSLGLAIAFVLIVFSSKIVTFVEAKFSVIVGQETHEWAKIKSKVIWRVIYMSMAIFVITFLISVIVGKLTGML